MIAIVAPLADHFFGGDFGGSATRPPFARERRGGVCVAVSAVEIRCMVDQRASSRPFSMREMSACGMPLRLASSACVQPSSIRRSRIESPGWESSASADQAGMRTSVCGCHIPTTVFLVNAAAWLGESPTGWELAAWPRASTQGASDRRQGKYLGTDWRDNNGMVLVDHLSDERGQFLGRRVVVGACFHVPGSFAGTLVEGDIDGVTSEVIGIDRRRG